MFKKILVAYDFSPLSEVAAKLSCWLASRSQGLVTLVNVLSDFRKAFEAMPEESRNELAHGDIEKFNKELFSQTGTRLAEVIKSISTDKAPVQSQVLLGTPFVALSHEVQKVGHDIVIAGTRDLGTVKRFLVGSTARNLVRYCPSAVWIVREKFQPPIKSIVAAIDFSEASERVLSMAAWLAQQSSASLHIVHVLNNNDFPPDMFPQLYSKSAIPHDWKEDIEKFGRNALADLISKLGITNAEQKIIWGEPCSQIEAEVERTSADLVVMGVVGRSGISGFLMGNTAEKILDSCRASILSVKPASFKSSI